MKRNYNTLTSSKKSKKEDSISNSKKEMVDHPDHYNRAGGMECLDEMIMIWGPIRTAEWCMMTAYKYRYRAGLKGSSKEDIEKSDWYMKKAAELRYCSHNALEGLFGNGRDE